MFISVGVIPSALEMATRWIFLCVLICFAECRQHHRPNKLHVIAWDPATSSLSYGSAHSIDVEMDDKMDILCPQYDKDAPKDKVNKFTIYNVSKDSFEKCSFENKTTKKIFDCKSPTRSRKLTTKFQKYSPNPMGFTFLPGNSYYYMAAKHLNVKECGEVMRMEIKVRPRISHQHKPTTSSSTRKETPPKTTTTTTPKPTKKSTIFIPKTIPVVKVEPDIAVTPPKVGDKDAFGGGSASSLVSLSLFWTVFIAAMTTLLLER